MTASFRFGSIKTGWQDTSIIHNQGIAWLKLINNIVKMLVTKLASFPVYNEQARRVSLLQRSLSNQFFRQVKIKISSIHSISLNSSHHPNIVSGKQKGNTDKENSQA